MPALLPIEVKNDSGEPIPSYAVMRPTGATLINKRQVIIVDKPNDDLTRYHLINGPSVIPTDGLGTIYDDYPRYALFDDGAGTVPVFNASWGAKQNTWELAPYRDGFTIWGNIGNVGAVGAAGSLSKVLVRQAEIRMFIGVLDLALNSESGGQAKIWVGAAGSEAVSEYLVNIQDWMIPAGKSIADGTRIIGNYINGIWYLAEAGACPTT